jgi:hypothetical protein
MKKIILIVGLIIVLAFVGVLVWLGPKISAGSYAYAGKYEIDTNEASLINIIQRFKNDHPQYNVPTQVGVFDGRTDSSDHWYHIYFYYPQENKIIYSWLRSNGKNETTFALVAVNDGLTLGNWKDFNKDFSRQENKENKKKFEERILNVIKREVTKQ